MANKKKLDSLKFDALEETTVERRKALLLMGSAIGSFALFGCSSGDGGVTAGSDGGSSGADAAGTAATDAGSTSGDDGAASALDSGTVAEGDAATTTCNTIADETSGPYPDVDGMISNATYYRSDITESKPGTPLTLILTVVDTSNGCAAIENANIEIWHCDKDGIYSEYSNSMNAGSTTTTWLRGVQTTDTSGQVRFRTIYPGWYSPRATHIHVQAYEGTALKKTTQIGFPDATNALVYAQSSLYTKGQNSSTDDTDQVFGGTATATGDGDGGGHVYQIASITGDTTNGFVASIVIGIAGFS